MTALKIQSYQYIGNISFLISVALHLLVIIILIKSNYSEPSYVSSLETTVFFEASTKKNTSPTPPSVTLSENVTENGGISSNVSRTSLLDNGFSSLKPRNIDSRLETIERNETSLKQYIRAPKDIKKNEMDLKGFLKGDHKASSIEPPDIHIKQKETKSELPAGVNEPVFSDEPESTKPTGVIAEKSDDSNKRLESVAPSAANSESGPVVSSSGIWKKKNDLIFYRNVIARLVTANWTVPPVTINDFQILVRVTIDNRGNVNKTEIIESSGLVALDAAAERAIRVSVPFPEFPDSFDPDLEYFIATLRFTPDRVGN